jgi:hypothetical protein
MFIKGLNIVNGNEARWELQIDLVSKLSFMTISEAFESSQL